MSKPITPTPEQIAKKRKAAHLTQEAAAALIHGKLRTWQEWEGGRAGMHPGLWELFTIKVRQQATVGAL